MVFTYYYHLYGINFYMVIERRADLMVEAEAENQMWFHVTTLPGLCF